MTSPIKGTILPFQKIKVQFWTKKEEFNNFLTYSHKTSSSL